MEPEFEKVVKTGAMKLEETIENIKAHRERRSMSVFAADRVFELIDAIDALRQHRDALQEANSLYLERARKAEAEAKVGDLSAQIRPIEWKVFSVTNRKAEVAETILGKWEIWQFSGGCVYIMKPGEHQGSVFEGTYDEAKAHLELAYQRRVLPAIEPAKTTGLREALQRLVDAADSMADAANMNMCDAAIAAARAELAKGEGDV